MGVGEWVGVVGGGGDQRHAPEKKAGTNFKGGCVSARDGLDGCRKLRFDRDSIPGSFSP
jgi:hypothetical protein